MTETPESRFQLGVINVLCIVVPCMATVGVFLWIKFIQWSVQ